MNPIHALASVTGALLLLSAVAVTAPCAVAGATTHGGASAPVQSAWTLVHTTYTPDKYTQEPFVGNGYLSQRLPAIGAGYEGHGRLGKSGYPLHNDRYTSALVAGVYESVGKHKQDYIASLPTWSTLGLTVGGKTLNTHTPASAISHYAQSMDMRHAIVTTSFTWTPTPGKATAVTYQVLANRHWMHLGQVRIKITPSWSGMLSLTGLLDGASAERITPQSRTVDLDANTATVQLATPGRDTKVAETEVLVPDNHVHVMDKAKVVPANDKASAGVRWTIPVKAGQTYTIIKYVGIATSNDPGSPETVAAKVIHHAESVGWDRLVAAHEAAWRALWKANIAVGSRSLQAAVNSSFYLLYSSLRKGIDFSIPPAGLSSDNYGGEIFWDADAWMFPSLLALHPGLAKSIVMFRYDTLDAARANATAAGYQGAAWAWDNGPTGTCGGLASCNHYEAHLQSEIALAQWQYYGATGNKAWLRNYGYPVIKAVATFWVSRVQKGADGAFHINNVTGPDEFTAGVNDDAATNAGAVIALRDAVAAAHVLGLSPDPAWSTIANHMYIAVSPDGTHPEYAGYTDETTKQADVVLMTYPLGYVTNNHVAAADLDRYMLVTDPGGPAMTASVESVIAAQTRQPGCLDYTLFLNAYKPFLRGAFDQFNETQYLKPSAHQSYPAFTFATGAGGFLQTFAYGFGGLRWHAQALRLDPTLPPQLRGGITITGLHYQGRLLTVKIRRRATSVTLTSGSPVTLKTPQGSHHLTRQHAVQIPTARPDQDPTDNLARCQPVTASSALPSRPPVAAVDGDAVSSWVASGLQSTYTVTFRHAHDVDHAHIHWGQTRPANYTIALAAHAHHGGKTHSHWHVVKTGSVLDHGSLDIHWRATHAQAVRLTFSGQHPASMAVLSVSDSAGTSAPPR